MIPDHTHFKTREGIIFTTRGFCHPRDKIRAIPLYKPSLNGCLEKSVDEFGDRWLYQVHPNWIQESSFGRGIFVPASEISETYDPFKSEEKIKGLDDKIAIQIISSLQEIGVDKKDIGLLGSYLFDTGRKPHDVDLIIRGLENMTLIKTNFRDLLRDVGGKNSPSEEYTKKSIPRYEEKYNSDSNDFAKMIVRRWPTIHVPGKFFGKLRFTYKPNEIAALEPPVGEALMNEALSGEVTNDIGTNFMPRHFQLRSDNKQVKVLTYFWDFSYCVRTGDRVVLKGDYYPQSSMLMLSNPKKHGVKFCV
jgi:predicted nucleotidyltransferase